MATGDLKGNLTASANSITNPTDLSGSVSVTTKDLIFVVLGQQTNLTATTPVTDNLGNTYTAVNAGTLSTVSARAYYSVATVAGTLTVVHVPATASTNDVSAVAAVIQGPFSTLDANPANTTDATTPFTCPATGALAQAQELVMAAIATAANQTIASTSPSTICGTVARANVSTGLSRRLVNSTSTVTPEFTGTSAAGVQIVASFRVDTIKPKLQDYWPLTPEAPRAIDLRTWAYNFAITIPAEPPLELTLLPSSEWQVPLGPEQPQRFWSQNLLQWTLRPTVSQLVLPATEWQLPEQRPLLGQTWTQNPLTLRVAVGMPPGDQLFGRQIVFPFPVALRTWIDRNPILPQPSLPPGETSFELPRGLQQPLYGWVWNYNRNLIGQDQLPVGDRLTDRLPDLLRTGQTWIGPLPPPVVTVALPPGEQFFALPPQRYPLPGATWVYQATLYIPIQYTGFASADWPPAPPYPDHAWLRTWIQNPLTLRTVVATPPFNQKDWPLPRVSAQPDRFWGWSYNLNLIGRDLLPPGERLIDRLPDPIRIGQTWIGLAPPAVTVLMPFGQNDWPVGRWPEIPRRSWTWSYNLNLIGKDAFPAGEQRTDLPPIGALQPLRGWTISLLQTTLSVPVPAPIGEQFYDLPPLLPTFLMDMSNNSRLNINLFPPPPPSLPVTTILMGQACL